MRQPAAEEELAPAFDSPLRKSTLIPATFNLVATIIGGGELSLPLAFQKCGILLATLLMIVAAIITDLSLWILCLAARHSGAQDYGEVGRMAFGKQMEWFISGLLFVFLLFVIVAYMILVRDIWTPLITKLPFLEGAPDDWILCGICVVLSPFLVQKELHALRYNCYVGFGSLAVLSIILCLRAWTTQMAHHSASATSSSTEWDSIFVLQQNATTTTIREYDIPTTTTEEDNNHAKMTILWTSTRQFGDMLFSLPIIVLVFLCHFNILPIQAALVEPTPRRVRQVIHGAVGACFGLLYVFGLAGYLSFGQATKGNILLNLADDDRFWVLVGRVGCGITVLFAMPMMVLPCRRNLLELLDNLMEQYEKHHSGVADPSRHNNDDLASEEAGELTRLLPTLISYSMRERTHMAEDATIHYVSTLLIVGGCYIAAVEAPGVAFVWSLCGSFMAYLISFILPCICYLQIERKLITKEWGWIGFSWGLLVFAIASAIACTTQTTYLLLFPKE